MVTASPLTATGTPTLATAIPAATGTPTLATAIPVAMATPTLATAIPVATATATETEGTATAITGYRKSNRYRGDAANKWLLVQKLLLFEIVRVLMRCDHVA